MKHKDSEEMLSRCDFIGSLLSHSHSDEKKRAKIKKEVEDEMRILPTVVRK